MGSGRGWSTLESVFACKAFVRASEDPIRGNARRTSAFQDRIAFFYSKLIEEEKRTTPEWTATATRTGSAVFQHFKKVKREVLRFEGLYNSVKRCELTGSPSEECILLITTGLYNKTVSYADMYCVVQGKYNRPIGLPFPYMDCWRWFHDTNMFRFIAAAQTFRSTSK